MPAENIKVSIIIPVYNVEEYLPKCLDSVVNQTLKDIEVICVDDCSTDSSYEILQEYASKDDRIIVLKQETNQGQGAARNRALDIAKGEYIMFLDPDDWYELDACELAYNQITKNENDIVIFNFIRFFEKNNQYKLANWRIDPFKEYIHCPKINLSEIKNYMQNAYTCTQIYSRNFLNKNNIKYAEQRLCEDVIFFVKSMINASNISIIEKPLYIQRVRKSSTSHQYAMFWQDLFKARYDSLDLIESDEKYEKHIYPFLIYSFNTLSYWYNLINNTKLKINKNFYNEIRKYYLYLYSKYDIKSISNYINNYEEVLYICNNSWENNLLKNLLKNTFYIRHINNHLEICFIGAKIKFKEGTKCQK